MEGTKGLLDGRHGGVSETRVQGSSPRGEGVAVDRTGEVKKLGTSLL